MAEKKKNEEERQQTTRERLEALGFEYVLDAGSSVMFLSKEQLAALKKKPKQGG